MASARAAPPQEGGRAEMRSGEDFVCVTFSPYDKPVWKLLSSPLYRSKEMKLGQ